MKNSDVKKDDSKKKNNRIFLIYFTTLIYTLITTASITDAQLILNDPVTLPIVNAKVSITFFFIISPIILISLFIFYNLHYLHLKEKIPEVAKYFHWPIFEFGKFNSDEVRNNRFINFIQISISDWILYSSLPIALFAISFRFSYTHNISLIIYQFILLSIGCFFTWFYWKKNLKDYNTKHIRFLPILILISLVIPCYLYWFPLNYFIKTTILNNPDKDIYSLIIAFLVLFFMSLLFALAFKLKWKSKFWEIFYISFWFYFLLSPIVILHYIIKIPDGEGRNVNLSYQILAQNPGSIYQGVYSVNLRGKNLEGANIISSVLVNADLREANLQYSALYRSTLDSSNMTDAKLKCSDLHEASFKNTIMNGVDFRYANLIGVKHLTLKQLLITKTLYKAKLDPIWLKEKEHNPRLYELHTTDPDSLPK